MKTLRKLGFQDSDAYTMAIVGAKESFVVNCIIQALELKLKLALEKYIFLNGIRC